MSILLMFFMTILLTLMLSTLFIMSNLTLLLPWQNFLVFKLFQLNMDFFFFFFLSFGTMVMWSIYDFSKYYMKEDFKKKKFLYWLLIFFLYMILLVSSKNIYTLFLGWEGVGIMSFILISWWYQRYSALSGALQAIIYNRIGDMGIFLTFSLIFFFNFSGDISILEIPTKISFLLTLSLMLASIGKSAQFGLHPWLPAAMEGPTPVSALLHSSTMVVAGVFLLIRFGNVEYWGNGNLIKMVGVMTVIFASLSAMSQNDIKKVIAYSTTSQLGLMYFTVGLGLYDFAFFHLCIHGFFKSLLFLCSGVFIHSSFDEQDLRKLGNSMLYAPFTSSCFLLSSLVLSGLPFFSAFYSKDFIMEWVSLSSLNGFFFLMMILSLFLSNFYMIRSVWLLLFSGVRVCSIIIMNEKNKNIFLPLFRLIFFSVTFSWVYFDNFLIKSCEALTNSSLGIVLLLIILVSWFVFLKPQVWKNSSKSVWYFSEIFHFFWKKTYFMGFQQMFSKQMELGWTNMSYMFFTSNLNFFKKKKMQFNNLLMLSFLIFLYYTTLVFF